MKITFIDIEGRTSTIESSQVTRCEKLDTKDRQAWRGIVERRDAKGICTSFGVGMVWLSRNEATMFALIRELEAGKEVPSWPL